MCVCERETEGERRMGEETTKAGVAEDKSRCGRVRTGVAVEVLRQ